MEHGFITMIPKKDIIELDISAEEGFKYIISMGVIVLEKTINRVLNGNKLAETASEP